MPSTPRQSAATQQWLPVYVHSRQHNKQVHKQANKLATYEDHSTASATVGTPRDQSFLDTVLPKGDPSTIASTRKCGRKNTLKRHAISSAFSWAACFTAFLARRCSRLMRFAMADRCQGPSVGSLIRDSSASIARPKRVEGCGLWVVGCLVVGCWLLVVGCWLLVVGCWLLVVWLFGCWLLVVGCWLLVVGWLVVGCWLLVTGCWFQESL